MKKILCILLMLCVLMAGCSFSKENQKESEKAVKLLKGFANTSNTVNTVKNVNKDYIVPAVKLLDEYRAEEKKLLAARPKDDKVYEDLAKIAEGKYLPKLREYQKAVKDIPVMKMTSPYFYYAKRYCDLMVNRLDRVVQIAKEKDAKKLGGMKWYLGFMDRRHFVEVHYGYQREYSLFTRGKETYELNMANFGKLRKGQTYEQIMDIFKMPGEFMPNVRETRGKSIISHQVGIWQIDGRWVAVEFQNNRATWWRQYRIDGWM